MKMIFADSLGRANAGRRTPLAGDACRRVLGPSLGVEGVLKGYWVLSTAGF